MEYDIIPLNLNPRKYIGSLKFVPYSINAKKLEKIISTIPLLQRKGKKNHEPYMQ
jgi:hypothetical protein